MILRYLSLKFSDRVAVVNIILFKLTLAVQCKISLYAKHLEYK